MGQVSDEGRISGPKPSVWVKKHWKKVVLASIVVLVIVTVALLAVVFMDVAGYSAKDSMTMEPEGSRVGDACVIYNPGLSGQAKEAAMIMGRQLATDGYFVTVAGVKSEAARDISDCDIVIIGGPMYGGKSSSSIAEYLGSFSPTGNVSLGVYTTTGNTNNDQGSLSSLREQVVSLVGPEPNIITIDVRLILTINVEEDCRDLARDLIA